MQRSHGGDMLEVLLTHYVLILSQAGRGEQGGRWAEFSAQF